MKAPSCAVCGGEAANMITVIVAVDPDALSRPLRFYLCQACRRAQPQPRKMQLVRRAFEFRHRVWVRVDDLQGTLGQVADRNAAGLEAKFAPRLTQWSE